MRDQDPQQISAVICDPAKGTEKIYKLEGEEEEQ